MAKHKILVIDDSKVIRLRVKDMLKDMVPAGDCEILEAADGIEGLNLLRTENPNLIMLDFLLPKMSGWEVYQEIQKQPKLKTIPLVIMSGRKEEVTEKITEPFDYFAFVDKPFDKQQLIEGIREAMRKAKELAKFAAMPSSPDRVDTTLADKDVEIQRLKAKVAQMESEINLLKKKLSQVVRLIKQKLL